MTPATQAVIINASHQLLGGSDTVQRVGSNADLHGEGEDGAITGDAFTFQGTIGALSKDAFLDYYTSGQTYVLRGGNFLRADNNEGMAAHHCWLTLAGNDSARMTISVGTSTGLDNGQMEQCLPNSWYTLDGRKLDGKPTKKGLYINNGQKTVMK